MAKIMDFPYHKVKKLVVQDEWEELSAEIHAVYLKTLASWEAQKAREKARAKK